MSSLKPYADLKVKTREYTDKDGKTKGVYEKVGTLFSSPHGSHMAIKLDTIPVGNWEGWLNVYKKEEATQVTSQETTNEVSSDIQL